MTEQTFTTLTEDRVREHIARCIDQPWNNLAMSQMMRDLSARAPALFSRVGVSLLNGETGSRKRNLAKILINCPVFLTQLVDPKVFQRDDVFALCRYFMEVDPAFDVLLAHQLPGRAGGQDDPAASHAARTLEILDEISNGARLVHVLSHLTESADKHIASKATIVLGRRIASQSWISRRLMTGDARLRANLLEALWGRSAPDTREIFQRHLADTNNRVAGNALIGLYLLGERGIPEKLLEMSRHESANFRSTAAWVMGKIGSPEFGETLREMRRDASPTVRRSALSALVSLRRAAKGAVAPEARETAESAPSSSDTVAPQPAETEVAEPAS